MNAYEQWTRYAAAKQRDRVLGYVEVGVQEGATLALGVVFVIGSGPAIILLLILMAFALASLSFLTN